jgi:uncharacterized protein GlcG (DUF336 family)
MINRFAFTGPFLCSLLVATVSHADSGAKSAPAITIPQTCARTGGLNSSDLSTLAGALRSAVAATNGGLAFNMWATVVAKDGSVCAVVFSGANAITDQWLHSRVISAQKAATANGLSLATVKGASTNGNLALSTANLYSAVQPGGSLYGLQHSNPVAELPAYGETINSNGVFQGPANAPASVYGTSKDPMIGQVIGGVNVFGGGLALFSGSGRVGGIGVSGDTSCTDHMVAWRVRSALHLDNFSATGVSGVSGDAKHPDNIIFDINNGVSAGGFGHPKCLSNPDPSTLQAVQ